MWLLICFHLAAQLIEVVVQWLSVGLCAHSDPEHGVSACGHFQASSFGGFFDPTSGVAENGFKRDHVDAPWWRLRVSTAVQELHESCRDAPRLTHGAEVDTTVRSTAQEGSGLHVVEHVCMRRVGLK